jgi:hypothetical protein
MYFCVVTGILKEPASSVFYPEYGASKCLFIIFMEWGETESLGTAPVNEPAVSAPDDMNREHCWDDGTEKL